MNQDEKEKLLLQIPSSLTYQASAAERKIAEDVEKLKDPIKCAEYAFNYVRDIINKL